jgi:SulP family sulfate permease
VRMRKVPVLDASGMHALKEFYHKCAQEGTVLVLSGVKGQPLQSLQKYGLAYEIGEENILPHIDAALARARHILDKKK